MMEKKYYDSTNLFAPRNRTEKSPDYRGDVELSAELCAYIAGKVKNGETPKIEISMWTKRGQYGDYFNCRIKQGWEKTFTPKKQEISDDEIPF